MKRWTKEEEQFLLNNYINGPKYCAEKLNRTCSAIEQKAAILKLTKTKVEWSKQEEEFLVENYKKGSAYCAEELNRTIVSVRSKARRLNLTTPQDDYWSEQELEFLISNYTDNGPTYCAEKLNRTYNSVRTKAGRLNLRNTQECWSEQEINFLINNYPDKGPAYCAEKLNRTYASVVLRGGRLNLKANTNYNSNIVYIVYFPDHFLYKVGITNNVERRIKEFGHLCVVLKTQECETSQEAAELERALLNSVTLVDTGYLNNGNTETFTEPSEIIKEFLGKQFSN